MPKRNPVLSMSGNMWDRLGWYRDGRVKYATEQDRTDKALIERGFVHERLRWDWGVPGTVLTFSQHGKIAIDSYREGRESNA